MNFNHSGFIKMSKIYGIIINGIWYSNRMERKIDSPNGIYSLDMDCDDFLSTLEVADIEEAKNFFKKSSKINVIRGVSFHDGIIPENPVKFPNIPLKVIDANFDELEEVEVARINNISYFIQCIYGQKSYALMDIKSALEKGDSNINDLKGITPEMRVVFMFHLIEKKQMEMEEEKKKALIPENYLNKIISENGAVFESFKKVKGGFEIQWTMHGHRINTLLGEDYRVKESGFCMSGFDRTQSVTSVVNVLKDYVGEGSYIHKTRSAR